MLAINFMAATAVEGMSEQGYRSSLVLFISHH